MPLTTWDLGGCGCGCPCYPCALPESNLSLAFDGTAGGHGTGSGTLVYSVAAGVCRWDASYTDTNGIARTFHIECTATCTYYLAGAAGATSVYYEHPTGCSGLGAPDVPNLLLGTYTCSPLSVQLLSGIPTARLYWTITP